MYESKKYNRTLHAGISLGSTSDDRFMPSGYVQYFSEMDLVITEKLDGQNNCFSKHGLFARSHAAPSILPWDKPLRERWELIKDDLDDLEIFGENMYGVHSIEYSKLESYFYVFGVRRGNYWLSWDDVKEVATVFDFPTVPEIQFNKPLSTYKADNENFRLENWFTDNLGMSWEYYVNTPGKLGGKDTITGEPASEGFVVRNKNGFLTNGGGIKVLSNEFNNLFKVVRKGHVQTDEHWTKNWKPAKLIDYDKYKWSQYSYLENV